MISACIADPFTVRLRIREFDVWRIHRTPQGRKRQAAPSLRRTYREHMKRVNQEWAGDIETRAPVAIGRMSAVNGGIGVIRGDRRTSGVGLLC
jgi:hypothetical protein